MDKRSNFQQLKPGSYLSETQYYQVLESIRMDNNKSGVLVRNDRGFTFSVSSQIVEEGMYSADQYESEESVTRTELVGILEGAGDTIFTVNFNKQIDPKRLAEAVSQGPKGKMTLVAAKNLLLGEERTLIGYLLSTEAKMGRSQVVDLELPVKDGANPVLSRIRQVDHRTLNWIIIRGVKYTQKG